MGKSYAFVGSEATGAYSNSYVCEGVFVEEDFFNDNTDELVGAFSDKYFYELDGKHSEVEGSIVIKRFGGIRGAIGFAETEGVCYETYHLNEYIGEGSNNGHVSEVYEAIEEAKEKYREYSFVLTEKEFDLVRAFIEEVTEWRRHMLY